MSGARTGGALAADRLDVCYNPDTFHFFSHMTHYLTRAETPMTHTDSRLMTHYLRIIPYDIITDVTMTHADSYLLTTYVIMTHS